MNRKQWNRDSKKFNDIQLATIKCKCGHSILANKEDKILCNWCGRYAFKDKVKEFEYRLKEKMNRSEK